MPATKLNKLAVRQLADYRNNEPGTSFADSRLNLSVKQAYMLQDAVTRLRVIDGEKIAGYKVGCVGPGTTEQFGMKGPIRATLFLNEIYENGTELKKSAFCNLAIEGEMAFKINNDCHLETIFPVIELHNFIFRGRKKTLPELISNNGINSGIVLPNFNHKSSDRIVFHESTLSLVINNQTMGTSKLWPNKGDPKTTLDWIKGNLAEYGLSLKPGQIILAGTTLGLYPVRVGDTVEVLVGDQIKVKCSIN